MITATMEPTKELYISITPGGVPHIGLRQIEAEYDLSKAKALRLMTKSGIEPYTWFNRSYYPEAAVRQHFDSLFVPQLRQGRTSGAPQ